MVFKRRFWLILGLLALPDLLGNAAFGSDWKILPGHVPRELSKLTPNGRLAATNQLRLAIGVPLRDSAGLDQFLAQLYDPASPNYRHYLTPGEFTARFGPTEQDYEAVEQFAQSSGLTIVKTHDNRLVLDVAGPAAAVENALHIRLQTYQHPAEARQVFAPDTEPTVAADLPVADIQGLSDYFKPHPRLKKRDVAKVVFKGGSAPDGSGSYFGNDFRNAYAAGVTLTGAGEMVGLLEFDGYYAGDIAAYAAAAGGGRANIVVQRVLLDGYDGVPTTGADSGNGEVSLDIEMAMAMAPGLSQIVVFEGGPNGFQNDLLNSMVQNSTVKNLACCWGWSGGPNTTTDNIFKEMASQGQSFFNASGDNGAFTIGANSANAVDDPNSDNAPSSSPYITEVGGTTLTMNGTAASYSSETVWNWGGNSGSSSGGVSSYYKIPSWQSGTSMAANQGSTTQRNIPDVALTADNVSVYYGNGSSDVFGGTSCAAPLWAGFMALVNQQAATLGKPAVGFINPAVYAIGNGQNAGYSYAACFHDTTTGNNFWSASPSAYSAVAGYDLCTGWGTPNGASLISALAGSTAAGNSTNTVANSTASLSIGPATGFAFSGVAGGPFTPASGTFQLTNTSASAGNWAFTGIPVWLNVAATNGTLAGNSTASLMVNLAAAAAALKVGSYSNSIAFTNLSAHVVRKIPVTLQVEQPVSVLPIQGFAATGTVGGSFTPNSQAFVLANASSSAMKWSLVNTSTWLTASATNGLVPAGGQSTVTVSLAASTKTLRAALYEASLRFTNSAGLVAVVPFTLSISQPLVQNGGFETGAFTDWTRSGNTAYSSVARNNAAYVHSGVYGARLGLSGTPGYLSQTLETVSGQTYMLSLWLRNSTGATRNWFQVRWNGAAIFNQTNLAAQTWTNLQFLVTASGASSVLELGFQNERACFGLDDVSLTKVASPSARGVLRNAGNFQLVWNTSAGAVYQAQYKTNLCQTDWINLGSAITAGADTLTMTDTNAFQLSPQRFYRLLDVSSP